MTKNDKQQEVTQTSSSFDARLKRIWKALSSAKLAFALILIIAALSLVGIFSSVKIFSSWYFIAIAALLMLNILCCNINRWKSIKKNLSGGRIKQSENFFNEDGKATAIANLSYDSESVYKAVTSVFQKKRYRLRIEKNENEIHIAADKNRFFLLGTYLSHLSIILLVLAAIIGGAFGFHEPAFIVAEGDTQEVGHDTGLSLGLISFTDSYYDDGMPSDYKSEVILYKDGVEVTRTSVRVNYPLSYEGVRFFQSFFGPAVTVEIKANEQTIYSGNIALYSSFESYGYYRNIGFIDIDEFKLSLAIFTPSYNAPDPMIPQGHLGVLAYKDGQELGVHLLEKDTPVEVDKVSLTFIADSKYSGFQVKSDPGNILVWIAFSLFIIGLAMVFYFPHSQAWILIKELPNGHCKLFVKIMASRAFDSTSALNEYVTGIKNKLN